jgi:PhnB protein
MSEIGYHSVNPFVVVAGAEGLIGWLTDVLGGEETERITRHDGSVGHAEVLVGDSIVMVSDAGESFPPRACAHYAFVDDVDAVYARALSAGSRRLLEPADQFYGNREAGVVDPFGNIWWLATVIEHVPAEELQQRYEDSSAS